MTIKDVPCIRGTGREEPLLVPSAQFLSRYRIKLSSLCIDGVQLELSHSPLYPLEYLFIGPLTGVWGREGEGGGLRTLLYYIQCQPLPCGRHMYVVAGPAALSCSDDTVVAVALVSVLACIEALVVL